MMQCFLSLVGVLQLICAGMSLSFMSESHHKATDTVNVQMVHSAHTREKRSTMQHPDILHLRFSFRGSEVQLNMTQKRRPVPNIPVYIDDGKRKVLQENLPDNEKFAVFRDQLQGSVLIVEMFSEKNCHVAGNFHHENKLYKIWPQEHRIHKRTADLESNHNILPVEDISDISNDILSLDLDDISLERLGGTTATSEEEDSASGTASSQSSVPEVARYFIEIGIFPDSVIYNFFLAESDSNSSEATANLRTYYSFLEDSTPEATPWIESARTGVKVDGVTSASAFIFGYIAAGSAVDTADHYMSFTGYDLVDEGSSGLLGIAYIGGLCRSLGVSVNEHFTNGRTALIAAHELAHSLNSSHDGEFAGINCNASAKLVMSPFVGYPDLSNPSSQWSFSTCTIEQFKTFLAHPTASCATETTITRGVSTGQNEGQVYNADAQCVRQVGNGSVFCRWCERGQCVANAAAPIRAENCPQGDETGANCSRSNCDTLTGNDLIRCCRTCAPFEPTVTVERFVIFVPIG